MLGVNVLGLEYASFLPGNFKCLLGPGGQRELSHRHGSTGRLHHFLDGNLQIVDVETKVGD